MPAPLARLDGPAARAWVEGARAALRRERDGIDGLNVYPVPDADTGTNLLLTLSAGAAALEAVPPGAGPRAVLRALADGAVRGARGSSGAILAQLLRGAVPSRDGDLGGRDLARALARGAAAARAAVGRPVEGTMLTVARCAADAALAAGSDLPAAARAAAGAASEAVRQTPRQLEALRRAGVVDAGGRGLAVVYDALAAVVTGRPAGSAPAPRPADPGALPAPEPGPGPAPDPAAVELTYLVAAPGPPAPDLARRLGRLGDDVVVGAGDGVWSVHVHVAAQDVDAAAAEGAVHGPLLDLRVEPLVRPRRS